MPNQRVYCDVSHPVFGRGYRIWDQPRFYEDHYATDKVRVIDYVSKADKRSVVTIVLPLEPDGTTYIQEWVRVRSMDWLSKAAAARAESASKENEVEDQAFAAKHPALYAFMTLATQGGKARELCRVQVFADAGTWKAALHDGNTEHSLFVSLGTPGDVFKALEKALTADKPDWRAWGKAAKRKK